MAAPSTAPTAAAFAVEDITKTYGDRRALDRVTFSAAAGERLAVIGPNGAGKTTLLQILAGSLAPTGGRVSRAPSEVGWVPQQPALYGKLSVEENLRLFARLERVPDPDATVARMLEQTGLGDRARDEVGRLSGGNQQRVNIAIGLLGDPSVLLLDEPTSSLDPRQREILWRFVAGLADRGTTVVYTTHNVGEAERYADRLLVLADGELLFTGSPAELLQRVGAGATSRRPSSPSCASGATDPVFWLLRKDLQILRRSPLLVSLLVIYPILIAVLIGFSLSSPPGKPKVAFANLVPATEDSFSVGGQELDATAYAGKLFEAVEPIRVGSREAAIAKVRDGEALGALVIPADAIDKLQSAVNLSGSPERPTIEVYYNAEDPLKRQYVESLVESRLGEANRALTGELTKLAGRYLGILLEGGSFAILGREIDVLGLQRSRTILEGTIASLPRDAPERVALQQVSSFAKLAIDNLDLSDEVLNSVGSPVRVKQTVLDGEKTPLDAFAVAVAITISLMFVTLLLAAGMLALEREEHTFARLVRGLVSRTGLLAEKIGLAALCSFLVTLVMLIGLAAFVGLDFGRAPRWIPALALSAVAFAAMGVAIGGLAREVRAASLLAFLLSLPIAFLALVPSGSVAQGLYDAIQVVSALFPFKPALEALDAAINGADPGLARPLAHLAALTLGFGALARLGLRRFG
jgi:ABC-2 type transport system permease protein